jgi:hypothetical protein
MMTDGETMDAGKASLVLLMKVYAWNGRKRRFSPRRIGIAYEALRSNGWLRAT